MPVLAVNGIVIPPKQFARNHLRACSGVRLRFILCWLMRKFTLLGCCFPTANSNQRETIVRFFFVCQELLWLFPGFRKNNFRSFTVCKVFWNTALPLRFGISQRWMYWVTTGGRPAAASWSEGGSVSVGPFLSPAAKECHRCLHFCGMIWGALDDLDGIMGSADKMRPLRTWSLGWARIVRSSWAHDKELGTLV